MMITRRGLIKLLAEGIATLVILRFISLISSQTQINILRPPGAVEEEYFNRLCIRCGICLEVCPTKTITLANFEDGIMVVNTPKIDPKFGPCEFFRGRCEEVMWCSKFCPTGALQLIEKNKVKIGTVEFIKDRCLAHMGKVCLVCNEACPIPGAIMVSEDLKPIFNSEKCVGCGICVYSCPADPKALNLLPKGVKRAEWRV